MKKSLFALSLLILAAATGCVHNTVTNLTATEAPRVANGMYRVEYQWDSTMQTIHPESIRPVVVVGTEQYEMKPVMKMNNRWEAWVRVPPGQTELDYHFKIAYKYTGFGRIQQGSTLSRDYKLIVK